MPGPGVGTLGSGRLWEVPPNSGHRPSPPGAGAARDEWGNPPTIRDDPPTKRMARGSSRPFASPPVLSGPQLGGAGRPWSSEDLRDRVGSNAGVSALPSRGAARASKEVLRSRQECCPERAGLAGSAGKRAPSAVRGLGLHRPAGIAPTWPGRPGSAALVASLQPAGPGRGSPDPAGSGDSPGTDRRSSSSAGQREPLPLVFQLRLPVRRLFPA